MDAEKTVASHENGIDSDENNQNSISSTNNEAENNQNSTSPTNNEAENGKENSKRYSVEISGLPNNYKTLELQKLIKVSLQLDYTSVKSDVFERKVIYFVFPSEKIQFKAITIIDGYKWHGSVLSAIEADPKKDPVLLTRMGFVKVDSAHRDLPVDERLEKTLTPYLSMEYNKQLKEKTTALHTVLKTYCDKLFNMNPDIKPFLTWQRNRRNGQVCEIDDIVESPVKESYCTSYTFVIGKNEESGKPVIGIPIGNYQKFEIEYCGVDQMKHLNGKLKNVIKSLEQYFDLSAYAPFDLVSEIGVWRFVMVKVTNNDDVLVVVQIHPGSMLPSEIEELKDHFKNYFSNGEGAKFGITSLYLRESDSHRKTMSGDFEHICGKTYVEETYFGKQFKFSPSALSQDNSSIAEKMYEKVVEIADVDKSTSVLEIKCGSCVFGLSLADRAKRILGLDQNDSAIEAARQTAESLGIENASFVSGKIEDCLGEMLLSTQPGKCIVIFDSFTGKALDFKNLRTVRNLENVTKIYILLDAIKYTLLNLNPLFKKEKPSAGNSGKCFVPIRAIPFDSYPGMKNMAVLIELERYDSNKWNRIMEGNPLPKDQAYYDRAPKPVVKSEIKKKDKPPKEKKTNPPLSGRDKPFFISQDYYNRYDTYSRTGGGAARNIGPYYNQPTSRGRGTYLGGSGSSSNGFNSYNSYSQPQNNYNAVRNRGEFAGGRSRAYPTNDRSTYGQYGASNDGFYNEGYNQGYLAAIEHVASRKPQYDKSYYSYR